MDSYITTLYDKTYVDSAFIFRNIKTIIIRQKNITTVLYNADIIYCFNKKPADYNRLCQKQESLLKRMH